MKKFLQSGFRVLSLLAPLLLHAEDLPVKDQLLLWAKADQGVQLDEAQKVRQWDDLSGNGWHFVQANPDARPNLAENAINGQSAVEFDGERAMFSTEAMPPPRQLTAFLVVMQNKQGYNLLLQYAPAGDGLSSSVFHLISGPPDGNGLYIYGDGGSVAITHENSNIPLQWAQPGKVTLVGVAADGYAGETHLLCDGKVIATSDSAFGNLRGGNVARPFHLAGSGEGGLLFKGLIAEVILYGGTLTESERKSVETYLSTKYSIQLQ